MDFSILKTYESAHSECCAALKGFFVMKSLVIHFWTYTSNLTTVVDKVLKFMINGTTSILKS